MIPQEIKEFIKEITAKALAIGNTSVNVLFSDGEVSIHLYPQNVVSSKETDGSLEAVEVYEDD